MPFLQFQKFKIVYKHRDKWGGEKNIRWLKLGQKKFLQVFRPEKSKKY